MSQAPDPDEVMTSPGLLAPSLAEPATAVRTVTLEQAQGIGMLSCRLQVTAGPHAGVTLASDRDRIRIGVAPTNDLVLAEDRTASRSHCEIHRTERGYLLVDLASTNGTFVDGNRVERAYLSSGAQLRVGSSGLVFSLVTEPLQVEPEESSEFGGMVGQTLKMRQVFSLVKRVAPMDVPVIIQGETGTGKELVAKALHAHSSRKDGPLVVLDCGAIPENLIESELFGHEKGAFTGATTEREGAFERARGGTIFLDELGELRVDLQPKLLRVLENREVRRVGANHTLGVDVRVIAATNRDLQKEISLGNFREDLFFRLAVIQLQLPPLRDRREDIPLILRNELNQPERVQVHGRKRFTPRAMSALTQYAWPGNVRELVNVLSHVLTFADGDEIDLQHLPPRIVGAEDRGPLPFNEHLPFKDAKEQLLEGFEREYVNRLLERCEGNISRAARESGLHRKSIERLLKKYQLDAKAWKVKP